MWGEAQSFFELLCGCEQESKPQFYFVILNIYPLIYSVKYGSHSDN